MSLQNFSLPFAAGGYFGVDAAAAASAPAFLYSGGPYPNSATVFGAGGNEFVGPDNVRRKPYQVAPAPVPASPPLPHSLPSAPAAGIPTAGSPATSYRHSGTHYTRVTSSASQRSGKTSVHAIVDYDDDFGDGENSNDYNDIHNSLKQYPLPTVTPVQGPIYLKNGSVPVVPLYSYPKVNNGSFVQIPIMWAALSLALGYEIRGDVIRGAPCIKRHHQLFCPTAGTSYPKEQIDRFIDENKALVRRMYGEFESSTVDYGPDDSGGGQEKNKRARNQSPHPLPSAYGESYFNRLLNKRQTKPTLPKIPEAESGRIDSCESKQEVVTPYWAANSAGKTRAIVNTEHFEQAIHQEVCSKSETRRCSKDCRCEQKYKWHRLLAYDPQNDCKGIFMDWFLFPSCCVCRCKPN